MDWLSAVAHLRAESVPGVLITVVSVRGHAPRDPGAKMVVGTERTWGSVGGGNLEETAIDRARELLRTGASAPIMIESRLNEHERTEHGRQCCGGVVQLLLEPLPARPAIAVFGVGHVGYELARILARHEVQLHLIDSRAEQLDALRLADVTDGAAQVTVHRELVGEVVLDRLPRGAHVLIMTHDHAEDFALCDAALRLIAKGNGRLGSIGLIGSSAKWARFRKLLAAEGHDDAAIATITSPIGLPGLPGKEPAVIAVSVAAALLPQITGTSSPEPTASRPEPVERPISSGLEA
jgi:xanthine dehydrogenase accessory factor